MGFVWQEEQFGSVVGAAGSVSSLILSRLLKILINCNRIVFLNPGLVTYLGV